MGAEGKMRLFVAIKQTLMPGSADTRRSTRLGGKDTRAPDVRAVAAAELSWPLLHGQTGKDAPMARAQLKVYHGPESRSGLSSERLPESSVRLTLGEVLPLLADAVNSQRTWLRDFKDDEITISNDLHEVILAYQYCRRPSA
jgi:hypothetical protein